MPLRFFIYYTEEKRKILLLSLDVVRLHSIWIFKKFRRMEVAAWVLIRKKYGFMVNS